MNVHEDRIMHIAFVCDESLDFFNIGLGSIEYTFVVEGDNFDVRLCRGNL